MRTSVLTIALLAGLATGAAAQTTTKEPPLKGPAVKDGGVPGEQRRFGGGEGGKRKDMMGQMTPYPVFMRAMESLRGGKATAETRLSSEQESQIKTIEREYRESVEKFRNEHKQEMQELKSQLPANEQKRIEEILRAPGQRPGQKPDKIKEPKAPKDPKKDSGEPMQDKDGMKDSMEDQAAAEKARARLRELVESMPKPADSQARIYALMSEPQKKAFGAELERVRAEMGKDRQKKPDGSPKTDQLPERVRERLKDASPEERERILKQLEERRKQRSPQ